MHVVRLQSVMRCARIDVMVPSTRWASRRGIRSAVACCEAVPPRENRPVVMASIKSPHVRNARRRRHRTNNAASINQAPATVSSESPMYRDRIIPSSREAAMLMRGSKRETSQAMPNGPGSEREITPLEPFSAANPS